jgi:hypothetical protein
MSTSPFSPLFQDLLDLGAPDGLAIDVLSQPLRDVGLDRVGPPAIDPAGGIDPCPQTLVAEPVPR